MASIRRQISIAAGPRAVWNTLTTADGWMSWYADDARLDARKGGRVVLTIEDDEGEPVEEVGTFHTFRPTRRLEISWDRVSPAVTKGTQLSFTIARDGEETRVNLVHSGGGVLDDEDARAELDKTWRQALSALRDALEG
ncbi:MAG: SRPBCC domain-containing protein [Myxococcota bacterium]|nr:SRPBCC domain-containing protein [Myxococcota bacterium]